MAGGADHPGTARSPAGACFTGDHRRREIPRRNGREDPNRLFLHDNAAPCLGLRNGVAVDAFAFFGKPLDKGRRVGNLTPAFSQRLALFCGHDQRQIVLILHHQLEQAAQFAGTFFGGQCAPGRLGLFRGSDRQCGFPGAERRHLTDPFAGGRIVDLDALVAFDRQPLPIDIVGLAEQRRIFEGGREVIAHRFSSFFRIQHRVTYPKRHPFTLANFSAAICPIRGNKSIYRQAHLLYKKHPQSG
ncbi:hypothetical protein D3C81_713070 [compost metagenome]